MPWIYSQGVWLGFALPSTTVDVKSSEQVGGMRENGDLSLSLCLFHSTLVFFKNMTLKCFHRRLISVIDWFVSFSALNFF